MDFLKDLAIPQPLEHYRLVILLATISALVFVPYISYTLGASTLSVWLNRRARRAGDRTSIRFARMLVQPPFASKSVVAFLGVIPGISLVFSYAQILQGSPAIGTGLAAFGFMAVLAGLVLLYTYRYTFRVEAVLESFAGARSVGDPPADAGEVEEYRASNTAAHLRSGTWGVALLHIGVFLFAAASVVAGGTEYWKSVDSFLGVLLTGEVWTKYLLVLAFAAGAAGIGMQVLQSGWTRERPGSHPEVEKLARFHGERGTALGLLAIPLVLLATTALLPPSTASGGVYALAGIGLVLFLLAAVYAYAHFTRGERRAAPTALFLFFSGIAATVVGDYVAVATATKDHAVVLAAVHERELDLLKAKLGVGAPAATGEDIFNAKCSACHLWDQKKVGPPYFETVPKYAGKRAQLVAFVLNPGRVNTAYPPMPSQGLKSAEADSIVSYLLARVAAAGKMRPEAAAAPK